MTEYLEDEYEDESDIYDETAELEELKEINATIGALEQA